MKQGTLVTLFLLGFWAKVLSMGFEIKTSPIIDQPGVEILGDYKGNWYGLAFEKQGTLGKPPRYKIFRYGPKFTNGKTSPLYPSFGDKTVYLKSVIAAGKISLYYGTCEKLDEVGALQELRDGKRQMSKIFRQEYDMNTLEPAGEPVMVYNEDEDRFGATGIELARSEDGIKTALLIKCYYRQQKFKLILIDNNVGQIYSKPVDFKSLKEYLRLEKMVVSNNGQILIQSKVRNDIISLATATKPKNEITYYFFSIDKNGENLKSLSVSTPAGKDKFLAPPVMNMLNNGEIVIASAFYSDEKSQVVKGISLGRYNSDLIAQAKVEITPDTKVIAAMGATAGNKKDNGYANLEVNKILPLEGANFMLITEQHQQIPNARDKNQAPVEQRNAVIAYRFDDKLAQRDVQVLTKKQASNTVAYAFSVQAYAKGGDVYLFHNDDWEEDGGMGMSLLCTKLPATGTGVETKKIVLTADNFFTNLENLYANKDGKILFAEQKVVEFEDISKEVKLLEVTMK